MKFELIDAILDVGDDHIVTVKHVSRAEEYLADHFPTFPVLPGVMMLESMTQAARELCLRSGWSEAVPPVLGETRAFRYGRFVPPGWSLVTRIERAASGGLAFTGKAHAVEHNLAAWSDAPVAATGKITLRPVRAGGAAAPSPDPA